MGFDSSIKAGTADVEFRAVTGQAKNDVAELRRVYHESTDAMSDDAVKLAIANDRLNKAISRFGPESSQAKQAGLQYRAALEQMRKSSQQLDTAIDRNTRSLGQLERKAETTGRSMHRSLGLGITSTVTGLIGSGGLVYAAKQALEISSNLNEQTSKTDQVFGRAAATIHAYATNALGLARDEAEQATNTFGGLLRPMGLTEQGAASLSVMLTKLGVDLASFNNRSATDALEALRSGLVGEAEPLRTFGVRLSEARVQALALADTGKTSAKSLTDQEKALARVKIILKDTKLAQGDYARTLGGIANQEREAQKNWRNTEILLGQTLQPAYRHVLTEINHYLGDTKNQKELQDRLNTVLSDAGDILKGVAHGMEIVHDATAPVVRAFGGLDRVAQTVFVLGIVRKITRAASSFGILTASSATTRTKLVADAAAVERAWDTATRPRTLTVTETVAGGGTPAGGRGSTTASRPGPTTRLPGTSGTRGAGLLPFAAAIAVPIVLGQVTQRPSLREQQSRVYDTLRTDEAAGRRLAAQFAKEYGTDINELLVANPFLKTRGQIPGVTLLRDNHRKALTVDFGLKLPGAATSTSSSAAAAGAPNGVFDGAKPVKPRSTGASLFASTTLPLRFVDAETRASMTKTLTDDAAAAAAEEQYWRVQLGKAQKGTEAYTTIYQSLAAAHSQRMSALDQIHRAEQQHAKDAARKRKKMFDDKVADAKKLAAEYARQGNVLAYQYSSAALVEANAYRKITDARLKSLGMLTYEQARKKSADEKIKDSDAYGGDYASSAHARPGLGSSAPTVSFERQAQAFLEALSGTIRTYAGSALPARGQTTIVQHIYDERNPHSTLREAERAARAVYGG